MCNYTIFWHDAVSDYFGLMDPRKKLKQVHAESSEQKWAASPRWNRDVCKYDILLLTDWKNEAYEA